MDFLETSFDIHVKLTTSLLVSMKNLMQLPFFQLIDLMDVLREIPGREALKLRAEVSSLGKLIVVFNFALVSSISTI